MSEEKSEIEAAIDDALALVEERERTNPGLKRIEKCYICQKTNDVPYRRYCSKCTSYVTSIRGDTC